MRRSWLAGSTLVLLSALPCGAQVANGFDLQNAGVRSREIVWGSDVLAIPFGSPVLTCYYRVDLLEKLGRRPPERTVIEEPEREDSLVAGTPRQLPLLQQVGQVQPDLLVADLVGRSPIVTHRPTTCATYA